MSRALRPLLARGAAASYTQVSSGAGAETAQLRVPRRARPSARRQGSRAGADERAAFLTVTRRSAHASRAFMATGLPAQGAFLRLEQSAGLLGPPMLWRGTSPSKRNRPSSPPALSRRRAGQGWRGLFVSGTSWRPGALYQVASETAASREKVKTNIYLTNYIKETDDHTVKLPFVNRSHRE